MRKVIEEMWPSPVARRLRITRRSPGWRPLWSGEGKMPGLKSAVDSSEYSFVKYEPSKIRRGSVSSWSVGSRWRTCSKRSAKMSCSRP